MFTNKSDNWREDGFARTGRSADDDTLVRFDPSQHCRWTHQSIRWTMQITEIKKYEKVEGIINGWQRVKKIVTKKKRESMCNIKKNWHNNVLLLLFTNLYRTVRTYLSSARDQVYSHEWISIGAVESRSFLGAVIWSCPSPYFSVCAPGEHN